MSLTNIQSSTLDGLQELESLLDTRIWPPALRRITLENIPITNDLIRTLPATVISIMGQWGKPGHPIDDMDPTLLPPAITRLSLRFGLNQPCIFKSRLPQTLCILQIETGSVFMKNLLPLLPSSLTHLRATNTSPSAFEFHPTFTPLPHCLSHLQMEDWHMEHFEYLPRTLTCLQLSLAPFHDLPSAENWVSHFAHLPPTLTRFELTYNRANSMRPSAQLSLAHLTHLKCLSIKEQLFLPCHILSTLTDRIESLTVHLFDFDIDRHFALINPLWMNVSIWDAFGKFHRLYYASLVSNTPLAGEILQNRIRTIQKRALQYPDPRIRSSPPIHETITPGVTLPILSSVVKSAVGKASLWGDKSITS